MKFTKFRTKPVVTLFLFLGALVIIDFLFFGLERNLDFLVAGVGYLVIYLVARANKLSLDELGLSPTKWRSGLRIGLLTSLFAALIMLVVFTVNKEVFSDSRYEFDSVGLLLYALIWIPARTVVFEELVFRGVLPAILIKSFSIRIVYVISALTFGVWHILPAFESDIQLSSSNNSLFILGNVIFTSLAGALFYYLRRRSDSLIAPILLHWTVNATGVLFVFLATK